MVSLKTGTRAFRTIDIDPANVTVLERQPQMVEAERAAWGNSQQHLPLGGEVPKERALREPRPPGDLGHRGLVEPALPVELERCTLEPAARVRLPSAMCEALAALGAIVHLGSAGGERTPPAAPPATTTRRSSGRRSAGSRS